MAERMTQDRDGAVLTCTVDDCSYNRGLECLAPQITIGGEHPYCDTYTHSDVPVAGMESMVANCMAHACGFNESEACTARGVTVDAHAGHADCATFRV